VSFGGVGMSDGMLEDDESFVVVVVFSLVGGIVESCEELIWSWPSFSRRFSARGSRLSTLVWSFCKR
jgi:hypothetical protein